MEKTDQYHTQQVAESRFKLRSLSDPDAQVLFPPTTSAFGLAYQLDIMENGSSEGFWIWRKHVFTVAYLFTYLFIYLFAFTGDNIEAYLKGGEIRG